MDNALLQIALDIGIFEHFVTSAEPSNAEDLANESGADAT